MAPSKITIPAKASEMAPVHKVQKTSDPEGQKNTNTNSDGSVGSQNADPGSMQANMPPPHLAYDPGSMPVQNPESNHGTVLVNVVPTHPPNPPPYGQQAYGLGGPQQPTNDMVDANIGLALLNVFCCSCLGYFSIWKTLKSMQSSLHGQYHRARDEANCSWKISIVGIILGSLYVITWIIVFSVVPDKLEEAGWKAKDIRILL